MADKDKGKLTRLYLTVAENGYEIEASYEPKQTLSQRKGWVPPSYSEPKKCLAMNKKDLLKKIDEIVPEVKKEK